MSHSGASRYFSDLERQLESELREFEDRPPQPFAFVWTDAKGISRTTNFLVYETKATASITPPATYWVKKDAQGKYVKADQPGEFSEEKGEKKDFSSVKKSQDGTRIQGWTGSFGVGVTITFTIVKAGSKSQVVPSCQGALCPKEMLPYDCTETQATQMIAFVNSLQIPCIEGKCTEGETGMREQDEDLLDQEEVEDDADEFEFELDSETDGDKDEELEFELPGADEDEEDSAVMDRYAQRLHELSEREFESDSDLDHELDRAIEGMEEEFFTRRVKRRRKHGKGKKIFGNILRAGARIVGKVASKLPVANLVKAGTSLVRGDVKGALKNLGKAAVGTVGTAVLGPAGGALATSAMDALAGKEVGDVRRRRRLAIRRAAKITRDAYRDLADDLPENIDHPYVAQEVARRAVRNAMLKNGVGPRAAAARANGPERRVIRLRPGETLIIKG